MDIFVNWIIPIILSVLAIVFLILSLLIKKNKFTTRELTIGAVCIAFAYCLSWITMFEMPQSGSITAFSFFPLVIYAYVFGFRKGLVIGIAYGLLQLTQKPVVIHPVQLLLDYIFAFSSIAFASLPKYIFKYYEGKKAVNTIGCTHGSNENNKSFLYYLDKLNYNLLIGIVIVGVTRFIVATMSGVIFFWEYAEVAALNMETLGIVIAYSAVYNALYISVDIAFVFAAVLILIASNGMNYLMRVMKGKSL